MVLGCITTNMQRQWQARCWDALPQTYRDSDEHGAGMHYHKHTETVTSTVLGCITTNIQRQWQARCWDALPQTYRDSDKHGAGMHYHKHTETVTSTVLGCITTNTQRQWQAWCWDALPQTYRVFSRDAVLGGNCFCGERKCEEYPKNKQNLLLFGGEIQNLGGEISPPKGPEKNTANIQRQWQAWCWDALPQTYRDSDKHGAGIHYHKHTETVHINRQGWRWCILCPVLHCIT